MEPPLHPPFVIAPRWIIPIEPRGAILEEHAVAVAEGRIVALLPQQEARRAFPSPPWQWHEKPYHILLPGLINSHTHAAMVLLRGIADDLPLETWLTTAIWPREQALISPDFVYEGTWLAAAEMLASGITTALDMYFFPEASARAFAEAGMRAAIGLVVIDFPTPYAVDPENYLARGLDAYAQWRSHPLLTFLLAPHAPYTVSDLTLTRLSHLARQHTFAVHIHLNETADESPRSLQQHCATPLERLARAGLLELPLIAAHAVHLTPDELATLAAAKAALVHCPTSNLKLASGGADVMAWHDFGLTAALGTDGAASNNRLDLFTEMRHAALLAKHLRGNAAALPAALLLEMATLGGAKALHLDAQIGSIRPGKIADLILVSVEHFVFRPLYDPIAHLVWVLGREAVTDVWVAGVPKKRDNRLLLQKSDMELRRIAEKWEQKAHSVSKAIGSG
ncbi:MAG: TRZ/ATZ family hydrolase [Hydrogenophilus sp.]|nr:TRZ/ATZ family hydrolase [Hydrogenophilus sp.]